MPMNGRLAAACCLLVAACGGDGGEGARVALVDTVAGVERLTYGAAGARPLEWTADTAGILGDAFAEDEYQFNEVTFERLASDAAGNLYLLDRQGARVLVYGPDLVHRATYGRRGEGPGELNQPMGLEVGPGDTIWVSDFSNSRLTGYPRAGGDPRTIPFAENAGVPAPRMAVLDDGFIMQFRPLFNFGPRRGGGLSFSREGDSDAEGRATIPLVRLSGSLEPVDTLWRSPEPPMDMVEITAAERVMILMMAREFHPAFQWESFSDGGIVVSDTAAYALHLLDADGATERIVRREPAPRAATEADREAVRQRLREESESGGTSVRIGGGGPDEETRQRMLEQRLEKLTFAELIPRIVALRVDPQDRVWVGVSEETPDRVERIDVYDRSGRLLGELRDMPMPDVFLGRDRIGVLRRDELDVQQVVVLELGGRSG